MAQAADPRRLVLVEEEALLDLSHQTTTRTCSLTCRDLHRRSVPAVQVSLQHHQRYQHQPSSQPSSTTSATSRCPRPTSVLTSTPSGWHAVKETAISQPVEEPAAVEDRPHRLREERCSSRRCHRPRSRRRHLRRQPTRRRQSQAMLPLPQLLLQPPPLLLPQPQIFDLLNLPQRAQSMTTAIPTARR